MLSQSVLQSLLAQTRKELKALVALRDNMKPQMKVHYQLSIPGAILGYENYRMWHRYKVELSKLDKKISKLVVTLKELKREMSNLRCKSMWNTDLPNNLNYYGEFSAPTYPTLNAIMMLKSGSSS